jgi:hypothetical protein
VRIAEQNFNDRIWPEGQHFSRQLPVSVDKETGAFTVA